MADREPILPNSGSVSLGDFEHFTKDPQIVAALNRLALHAQEGYPDRVQDLDGLPRDLSVEDIAAISLTVASIVGDTHPKLRERSIREVQESSIARLGRLSLASKDTTTAENAGRFLRSHGRRRARWAGRRLIVKAALGANS